MDLGKQPVEVSSGMEPCSQALPANYTHAFALDEKERSYGADRHNDLRLVALYLLGKAGTFSRVAHNCPYVLEEF